MAEPIEVPFGLWTRVDQVSICYRGCILAHSGEYDGDGSATAQKRLNQSRCRLGYLCGPKETCIRWGGPNCHAKGQFFGGMDMPGHARRHSAVSCAKWLNGSRCRLGCGLE